MPRKPQRRPSRPPRAEPLARETRRVVGIYTPVGAHGIIEPVSRKDKNEYVVPQGQDGGAEAGEMVVAEVMADQRVRGQGRPAARVVERLGSFAETKHASRVAIAVHDIPVAFLPEAVALAEAAAPPTPEGREDLRALALVTIDGEDARDFDDAVCAEPEGEGWVLWVAIADVAHYVRPADALDKAARERGNSVYFPDCVVPMLPEALSNELCSLKPGVDRYCVAVRMRLDAKGNLEEYRFVRGIMKSAARFTYAEVQAIHDDPLHPHPLRPRVEALYGVYRALLAARAVRGTLDLDLPEYRVVVSAGGEVERIVRRERLDSHRLIEECMIAANVAAAGFLLKRDLPGIYRVHEPPDPLKAAELREFLKTMDYSLAKGESLRPHHFNRILEKVKDTPEARVIHTAILRTQRQAVYGPKCDGHFALALAEYCHFTSPIRRYSDVVVHRGILAGLSSTSRSREGGNPERESARTAYSGPLPSQGRQEDAGDLGSLGEHLSLTERRAMLAEREAVERYTVRYLAKHVGEHFTGVVANVTKFGLFILLEETGAQGFLPIRALGDEYFDFDPTHASLHGSRSGKTFRMGDALPVQLAEANTLTGSLLFTLARKRGMVADGKPRKPKHVPTRRDRDTPSPKGRRRRR